MPTPDRRDSAVWRRPLRALLAFFLLAPVLYFVLPRNATNQGDALLMLLGWSWVQAAATMAVLIVAVAVSALLALAFMFGGLKLLLRGEHA